MSKLISGDYVKQLTELHKDRFWGGTGRQHAKQIIEIAKEYKCFDALDYGSSDHEDCLKRHFQRNYPGDLLFYEYDPAVPHKSALPDRKDMVVCTDVLEHIEPEYLNSVLLHIKSCMRKCGYFVISTIPAKTVLTDGRNAHLIIEDKAWWQSRLGEFFRLRQMWWNESEVRIKVTKNE